MASDVLETNGGGGDTLKPRPSHHDANHDPADPATTAHPLAGAVLCCTAIPPETRSALAATAQPMGASHALDLTAAVTHLLVGHWDTAKYEFVARARPDVRVLSPSFIDAVREPWMAGAEAIDVAALERAHAVPALHGARVCVTGFGDADARRAIEARVVAAGGHYSGDLTRDVTHLVAARPEGAKYTHARQWQIHTVALAWLDDSLARGMLLDAGRYDPLLPPAEIGRGAWIRPGPAAAMARAQAQAQTKRKLAEDAAPGPRKLRRTASARFSSQNEDIWGDIVGEQRATEAKRDAWAEDAVPAAAEEVPATGSLAGRAGGPRRTVSTGSLAVTAEQPAGPGRAGLFSGTSVFIHGFGAGETAVLESHLRTHAATLVSSASAFASTYTSHLPTSTSELPFLILVPHTHQAPLPAPLATATSTANGIPLATDFYLESCLHALTRLDPRSSRLHAPLPAALPGFAGLVLSATGVADVQLLHLAKAVARLGAAYAGTLRKGASALLCPGRAVPERGTVGERREVEERGMADDAADDELDARDKVRFARAHGIPVVRADWLWACMDEGRRVGWEGWTIGARRTPRESTATAAAASDPVHGAARSQPGNNDAGPITRDAHATTTTAQQAQPQAQPPETKDNDTLAHALSTLLAARASRALSASRSTHPSFAESLADATDSAARPRRRRTLLGRAPSTASLRSVGSVGSANTDGVGTPLEVLAGNGNGAGGVGGGVDGGKGETLAGTGMNLGLDEGTNGHGPGPGPGHGHGHGPGPGPGNGNRNGHANARRPGPDNSPPQTQVAYADVPAQAWRRQMAARMGTGTTGPGDGAEDGPEGKGIDEGGEAAEAGARIRDEAVDAGAKGGRIRDERVDAGAKGEGEGGGKGGGEGTAGLAVDAGAGAAAGRRVLRRRG